MVDAVLLILREIIEAALIISLLLALSYKLQLKARWSLVALIGGFCGSLLVAYNAYSIAELFDGTGQELINSSLLLLAILCIVLINLILMPLVFAKDSALPTVNKTLSHNHQKLLYSLFVIVLSCSITREGSEIWIYLSSFLHSQQALYSAIIGGLIGAGIGISLGAIAYYSLVFMHKTYFLPTFIVAITLVAAGLAMQIANQLMQIGWLDSNTHLWDTSFFISERSWFGELLYALIGYDANPTAMQGIFYISTLAPIISSALWHKWHLRVNHHV